MAFEKIYKDDDVEVNVRWTNGVWQIETITGKEARTATLALPEAALDRLAAEWPRVKYSTER